MYPVFGLQGASWFLGISEWLFGALIFLGFWNKQLGVLGALGSCLTFIMTITIIPFMPDGWNTAAGGFPAMQGNVAFLMKDLVLFAVSFYLLKQDAERASLTTDSPKAAWISHNHDRLMHREDDDVTEALDSLFEDEGIDIILNAQVKGASGGQESQ
jgi:Protein of unknown function, DUF417/Pyridine nucleotide-disulphide oxidoreductase